MKKKIYINGRFLTKPMAGVQRTAYELVLALDRLMDDKQIDDSYSFELIYSGEIINVINLRHIKLTKRGFFTGNIWEQLELPLYTLRGLLISMSSISTLFKRKQILFVHDAAFWANKEFFSANFVKWYSFAIPFIAKICRQIVTVSNFSKDELVKYGNLDPKRITVIYNAADHILRFGEPSEVFKSTIEDLKPYCLAVSSLGANKNFKGLANTIKQIDFTGYRMLIAGGEMSTLKYAPSDDDTVNYLGYVSNEELKYLYANASLFIFPSFYEGFGIPPLEAMISHCPVVASNTSSIPEVLGDAAIYFDPYNSADMAENISATINDKTRLQSLTDKGYEKSLTYNWNKSGEQLIELIERFA